MPRSRARGGRASAHRSCPARGWPRPCPDPAAGPGAACTACRGGRQPHRWAPPAPASRPARGRARRKAAASPSSPARRARGPGGSRRGAPPPRPWKARASRGAPPTGKAHRVPARARRAAPAAAARPRRAPAREQPRIASESRTGLRTVRRSVTLASRADPYWAAQAARRNTGRRGNSSPAASMGESHGPRLGISDGNLLSITFTIAGQAGGMRGSGPRPAAAAARVSALSAAVHSSRSRTSEKPKDCSAAKCAVRAAEGNPREKAPRDDEHGILRRPRQVRRRVPRHGCHRRRTCTHRSRPRTRRRAPAVSPARPRARAAPPSGTQRCSAGTCGSAPRPWRRQLGPAAAPPEAVPRGRVQEDRRADARPAPDPRLDVEQVAVPADVGEAHARRRTPSAAPFRRRWTIPRGEQAPRSGCRDPRRRFPGRASRSPGAPRACPSARG